jgi:hypothetical protein
LVSTLVVLPRGQYDFIPVIGKAFYQRQGLKRFLLSMQL